ncbi:hypothetical protein DFJ77DRAFT_546399 [Powellomyces hirtus]|nr:hypothetical protein DFJ77DRAFT_546399 [Powellomyces hirtus]
MTSPARSSDSIADRGLLEEFLDLVERLDFAEDDECLQITDALKKRAKSAAIQRYVFVQRQVDVLDVVVPFLCCDADGGFNFDRDVVVVCNILTLLETLIADETIDTGGLTPPIPKSPTELIVARNIAMLVRHPTQPLYSILRVLQHLLPENRLTTTRLSHHTELASLACNVLQRVFSKGDPQMVSRFRMMQDPTSGGCLVDNVIADVVWRSTSDVMRLSNTDRSQCTMMVRLLKLTVELLSTIGKRASLVALSSVLISSLVRGRLVPRRHGAACSVERMIQDADRDLGHCPFTTATVARMLERDGNGCLAAIAALIDVLRRGSSLGEQFLSNCSISDLLAFVCRVRALHTKTVHTSATRASFHCTVVPPNTHSFVLETEAFLTSLFITRVAALEQGVVNTYVRLGRQHCHGNDMVAGIVAELTSMSTTGQRDETLVCFQPETAEESHVFVTFAFGVMSKLHILDGGKSIARRASDWNVRREPHKRSIFLQLALLTMRLGDACQSVNLNTTNWAFLTGISSHCRRILVHVFSDPVNWLAFPQLLKQNQATTHSPNTIKVLNPVLTRKGLVDNPTEATDQATVPTNPDSHTKFIMEVLDSITGELTSFNNRFPAAARRRPYSAVVSRPLNPKTEVAPLAKRASMHNGNALDGDIDRFVQNDLSSLTAFLQSYALREHHVLHPNLAEKIHTSLQVFCAQLVPNDLPQPAPPSIPPIPASKNPRRLEPLPRLRREVVAEVVGLNGMVVPRPPLDSVPPAMGIPRSFGRKVALR